MVDKTKVETIPAARKALYLETLKASTGVDSKYDAVIVDGAFCVTLSDGKKVIDRDVMKECATDFASVYCDYINVSAKSSERKDAETYGRRLFSNGVNSRMREGATIRQKDGKSRPAPFAGWIKKTARGANAGKGKTDAPVVAAIAVPVGKLRPLIVSAQQAANDTMLLLAAFQSAFTLDKAQTEACGGIAKSGNVAVSAIKKLAKLLPKVSDKPADAVDVATRDMAGNGADTPAS